MKLAVAVAALFVMFLVPARGRAQTNGTGAPNNPCQKGQVYTDNSVGAMWTCNSGTWQAYTSLPTLAISGCPVSTTVCKGGGTAGGPLYIGNGAGDNGTDSIGGILVNNTSLQSTRDQIGFSATQIWAPDATSPTSPFNFDYDSLLITGLGNQNTVSTLNVTTAGVFTANNELVTTKPAQTVALTNMLNFVANAPVFSGTGTMSSTNSYGFWAKNQGNSHVTTSYGYYMDAQSGSTGVNYGYYQAGAGVNQFAGLTHMPGSTCQFAFTPTTFTTALSPVTVCTFALPAVSFTWTWHCEAGWSNNAGTTPTYSEGVNWSVAPSVAVQTGNVFTSLADAGVNGFTSTATNANFVTTGTLTNSANIFYTSFGGWFISSASATNFSPTVSLTGTGGTGTLTGACTIY